MTRVLRSSFKKARAKEEELKNLSVSNNSKTIKVRKVATHIKCEDTGSNTIWDISPIMSTIFSYADHKDLLEFNAVCKKWNQLINPIIHSSIKLLSEKYTQKKIRSKKVNKLKRIDVEVRDCISNNSKFAPFVKEFKLDKKLEPKRAMEFFDVFKFITKLTVKSINITQDQFLLMLKPLNQLVDLALSALTMKKIIKKRIYIVPVQLPPTLINLTINHINLDGNTELFIQSINSHTNLKKFAIDTSNNSVFLAPFYKNYPSLKYFDFGALSIENGQKLFSIFEFNSQLLALKIRLSQLSNDLIMNIENNLINLEELTLVKYHSIIQYNPYELLKFSKSTKIKKLELIFDNLNTSSLDSILVNCPYLEDLNIQLHEQWKFLVKVIRERCSNLRILTFNPAYTMKSEDQHDFFHELSRDEHFTNKSYKSTLTHLTIKHFKLTEAKAEYFEQFKKLKSIKFPFQWKHNIAFKDIDKRMKLWPNYRFIKVEKKYWVDVELINLHL